MMTMPAASRLRGRNVISILDLAPDELTSLIGIAQQLKASGREQQTLLRGKTLAMLFEKPYYLVPQKNGIKGYYLLRDALHKTGKAAIHVPTGHTFAQRENGAGQ